MEIAAARAEIQRKLSSFIKNSAFLQDLFSLIGVQLQQTEAEGLRHRFAVCKNVPRVLRRITAQIFQD